LIEHLAESVRVEFSNGKHHNYNYVALPGSR
jgi:hypothetical protein